MKLDCASTGRSQTPSSNVVWVHGICRLVLNLAKIVEIDHRGLMKAHLATCGELCLPLFLATSYYL